LIVLDASVLIALLDADDAHHPAARSTLADQTDELAIPVLTLAEVAVGPARQDRLAVVHDAAQALELQVLPIDAGAWSELAVLRATTRLRMPDCCVLHAATAHAAAVATFDQRLSGAARAVGLTAVGM